MAPTTKASDKRILTSTTSRLTKVKLEQVLRKDGAWGTLDLETRQRLYSLLPPWKPSDNPDPDVNPLKTRIGRTIAAELRQWQQDLKDGRETKKWREEAAKAGRARRSGNYDLEKINAKKEADRKEAKEKKEADAAVALMQRLMERSEKAEEAKGKQGRKRG